MELNLAHKQLAEKITLTKNPNVEKQEIIKKRTQMKPKTQTSMDHDNINFIV